MILQGIESEVVSLENIVPMLEAGEKIGQDNQQLDQEFYDGLSQVLGDRIRQCGHRVPVVTGE
jgi:aspartate kinase